MGPAEEGPGAGGSGARLKELQADPEWKEAWRQRVRTGRRKQPPVTLVCAVCGREFEAPAWRVARGGAKTCRPACANEARCRALLAHHPQHQPGFCEQRRERVAWSATAKPFYLSAGQYVEIYCWHGLPGTITLLKSDPTAQSSLLEWLLKVG